MKRLILLALLFLHSLAWGQNLVKNGDFELFNNCPVMFSNMIDADFCSQPTEGTCDYFNACSLPPSYVGVPSNVAGGQPAYTGNAYGGFITFVDPSFGSVYKEYIQMVLDPPMTPGVEYNVCFVVSLSGYSGYASNGLGVAFNQGEFTEFGTDILSLPPAYYSNLLITDTTNWTPIAFNFTPTQAYDRIIVGGFLDDSQITTQAVPFTSTGDPLQDLSFLSYYYFDHIVVSPAAQTPQVNIAQNDTSLCTGQSITLTTENGEVVTWSTGEISASITVTPATSTTYYITPSECVPISDSIVVAVVNCATPNITLAAPDTICSGDCFDLLANVVGGITPYTYAWGTQGLSGAGPHNICPDSTMEYWAYVTDALSQKSDTVFITVTVAPCEIIIPDVFTPSVQDGINDNFVILNLPANSSIVIYNRWGTKVFSSNNYQNNWNGENHSDGVYYYIITKPNGKKYNGTVTKL